MTVNLLEGICKERDRLQGIKSTMESANLWHTPGMKFYRKACEALIEQATQAIGGNMDIVEMVRLSQELKDFES